MIKHGVHPLIWQMEPFFSFKYPSQPNMMFMPEYICVYAFLNKTVAQAYFDILVFAFKPWQSRVN